MKQKITYTLKDRETVIDEEKLHENKIYLKHFYHDVMLEKVEHYISGKLRKIEIFISDENISDEEILFKNIYISVIKIIREKRYENFKLIHEKSYNRFQISKEKFIVKDQSDRIISTYAYNDESSYNEKTIYSENGEKISFGYYQSGSPSDQKSEIEKKIGEFSILHNLNLDTKYYFNFFPFIPSGELVEIETCKYYSLGSEKEITLQEAFFKQNFEENIYLDETLIRSVYFADFEITGKNYFIYDNTSFVLKPEDVH